MPAYARWPPTFPVRSGVTCVAVRRGPPIAVGGNKLRAVPPARAPGVRGPRRPVSAHRSGTSIVPANRVAWTPARCTHYHRAHGDTDMRIVFLPASLARLTPDHPAVFMVSGLAREVLLA